MDATTALAIYRAEKDKALRERRVSHVQLMAEAQEAFRKMLADAQLARKGGRPKGSTNAANAAPAAAVVEKAPAPAPSKLVLKTTKVAPVKTVEKVTASVAAPSKAKAAAKPAVAAVPAAKAEKHVEKKRTPAKTRPVAKAPKRAVATARKGSAKKSAAPRKQAASRERRAKTKKH
jgi:hypothetical protein